MIKKGIILSILIFCSTTLVAQNIYLGAYNHIEVEENFNSKDAVFPLSTTIDNYFIVDNGDFFLNRNNSNSEYALFTKDNIEFSNFRLKTSIKLGPSGNNNPQAGIVLKAQRDGSGALVIDLNGKGQYRLRQLINGQNKYLSGSKKKDGWVKSEFVKAIDELNFIDMVTENGDYELFINHHFVTAITLPEYNTGSIGLIIGPQAKARVDYFYIYSTGTDESITYSSANNERIRELERILTDKNLAYDKLRTDKEAIEAKLTSIAEEKGALETSLFSSGEQQMIEIEKLNSRILSLEKEKRELEEVATVLDKEINSLFSFKETALQEQDELQLNISQLEGENATLNDRLSSLNTQLSDLELSLENEQAASTQINTLRETIQKLESEQTALSEKMTQLEINNADLNSQHLEGAQAYSTLELENEQLNNQITTLETGKAKLMNENQSLISSTKAAKEQKITLQTKLQSLEGAQGQLTDEITALESEVNRLETAVETVNFDLLKKTADYETVSASEKSAKDQLVSLTNRVADLSTLNATLNSDLSQEQTASNRLNEEISSLTNTQKHLDEKQKEQRQKIAALNQSNGTLKSELQNIQQERTGLLAQAKSLKDTEIMLASVESENTLLNSSLNEQNKALKSNKEKLSKLELIQKQTVEKLNHSLATNDQLKEVSSHLNSSLSDKESLLVEREKIISSLSMKKQAKEKELLAVSEELSNTKAGLDNTEYKLAETENKLTDALAANASLSKEYLALKTQYEKQKDISKNFANSYRLETEKNKQLEKEMAFTSSSMTSNTNRSSKTIYRVQLGTFGQTMEIDGLNDVTTIPTQNGEYIYLSGKFNSYSDAKVRLLKAMDLGFRDAFIVKF